MSRYVEEWDDEQDFFTVKAAKPHGGSRGGGGGAGNQPRRPSGTPQGGEFAPTGNTGRRPLKLPPSKKMVAPPPTVGKPRYRDNKVRKPGYDPIRVSADGYTLTQFGNWIEDLSGKIGFRRITGTERAARQGSFDIVHKATNFHAELKATSRRAGRYHVGAKTDELDSKNTDGKSVKGRVGIVGATVDIDPKTRKARVNFYAREGVRNGDMYPDAKKMLKNGWFFLGRVNTVAPKPVYDWKKTKKKKHMTLNGKYVGSDNSLVRMLHEGGGQHSTPELQRIVDAIPDDGETLIMDGVDEDALRDDLDKVAETMGRDFVQYVFNALDGDDDDDDDEDGE